MKVALISAYSGPVKRGVESWVEELANRLVANGDDACVFRLGDKGNEQYRIETVGINVDWKEIDTSETKERTFNIDYWSAMLGRFSLDLLPKLIEYQPDIVIPVNGGWETVVAKKYCEYSGTKLVAVGHWDDNEVFASNPDLYIATSDRQVKWAESIYERKVKLIYSGVDVERFRKQGKEYPLQLLHPRVLVVGALVAGKNIIETIKAVAKIDNVSLVVCGDGDLRGEIEELGKGLLGEQFIQLKLDQEEMPKLYRSCDLFTLVPDESEAFGLVYLEAMASGLGVVAVDDEVRRKIVGDAGLFVKDPKDTETYAQVLSEALEQNYGERPRIQAEKFSWDKVFGEYNSAFRELVVRQ